MSKNIFQVYQDNPIVTNQAADLMYFGRAPYGLGDDTAMQFSDFAAQFGASYTPSALTKSDDTNVTLTLGGTPATALLQPVSLALGWSGLLAITRGGTGVGAVTTVPTATAFAGWDANKNLSANNFLVGTTLVTNSGGTTTLTVSSTGQYIFSGATFQTVELPVVATLVNGAQYRLINDSSNALFVVSSGANAVVTMQPLTSAVLTFNGVAGTAAASWSVDYTSNTIGVQSITGTANQVIASSPTGNVTLSLPQDIATTSNVTFGTVEFSSITVTTETPMLYDSYGNVLLAAKSAGPGAVNFLSIINNGPGNPVGISALGSDADIGLSFGPKGAGAIGLNTAAPTVPLIIYNGTGGQHQTNFIFANTANARNVTFQDASGTVAFLSDISGSVNAGTANQIAYYATTGSAISGLTGANSSLLVTNSSGVPAMTSSLTNGQIVIGSTGATPTPATLTAGNGVNITNGAGSITIAAPGALKSFQIFTSGSGTYTRPAGITSILVEGVGAGGGGGGITAGATTIAVAGGGGGGGYFRKWFAASASSYSYAVGSGGAGGVGLNNGTAGNNTTFDTLTGNGGAGGGGANGIVTSAAGTTLGGAGGTATNGDININGSGGGIGFNSLSATASGTGGGSFFAGFTESQAATTANGIAGKAYGGGGGGALGGLAGGTSQNGGAGAAGVIIVWEFA